MNARDTPRIGLLGCGRWGINILRDLVILGADVRVVDPDPEARKRSLEAGAASDDVVDPTAVDAWVVATPASTHADVIESIAAAGLPILSEKPLAASVADAARIRAAATGPLHVMDVWRYHPAVERLQEIAAENTLGDALGLRLTRANWTSPRTDVDAAWNLLPHDVSIYRQVFGAEPEPLSALAETVDGVLRSLWSHWSRSTDPGLMTGGGIAAATRASPASRARAGRGPWMVSEVSNRFESRRREIRLHASEGVAVFDAARPKEVGVARGAADDRLEASERTTLPLSDETALRRQLSAWLGFLSGGPEPRTDVHAGVETVRRVAAARALAGL